MRNSRFITLTIEEHRTLQEASNRGPKYAFRMRCLCLLLSSQGCTVSFLIEYFEVKRRTIYHWMDNWEQQGLAGLYHQPHIYDSQAIHAGRLIALKATS